MFLNKVIISVSRAFRQLVRDPRVFSRFQNFVAYDKKFNEPYCLPLHAKGEVPRLSVHKHNLSRDKHVKKAHRVFESDEGFASLTKASPQRSSTYYVKVEKQTVACNVMLNSPTYNNSRPGSIATTHSSEWSSDDESAF
mmetsp:Transcript_31380/g.54449  ORF Transcript_31380/g.54449 Transcript_31380/m.54449 type:complete len:139 (-) Transcript_31380:1577-1993(-)